MSVVDIAQGIARVAHEGQVYVVGTEELPYFEAHLEPVANFVRNMGYDDKTIAAAYLHDAIEDTETTSQSLLKVGIPSEVVEAIIALTHKDKESLPDYIARICLVPRAIAVKFADSTLNLKTTIRTKDVTKVETFERRKLKYEGNLRILRPLLPSVEELSD